MQPWRFSAHAVGDDACLPQGIEAAVAKKAECQERRERQSLAPTTEKVKS